MARTQINFRLRDGQKERWREHVEESRYDDTLSDLVKRAVENQIDRDTGDVSQGDVPERDAAGSGEVIDRIQSLRNDIEDLEGEVSRALDAVHGQEGIDPDLPPEVYAGLPVGKENAKTVEEIVQGGVYGFSEAQARFALEHLARNVEGSVHRVPEGMPGPDEQVRWYKEE